MSQHYSNPARETEPTALPDVEVFYMTQSEIEEAEWTDGDNDPKETGWYYWFCFPGCLPDSEPNGPFSTKAEAIADAQEQDL